jgi:signal transduction histidine kinase
MTAIVNELLLAATGGAAEAADPVDVASVARSVAADLQDLAEQQGVQLAFTSSGAPFARIDPGSLRRAVLALADNALTHTPDGGKITISASAKGAFAVLQVADTGTGITGVDPDRIFDRFVRAPGPGNSPVNRSFGIGLALVREIASGAGGTVKVARTGPDGTTMRLALPLARN